MMRHARLLLAALLLCAAAGAPGRERVALKKISDGDTIRVIYHGASIRVRLLGIDAPESHENEKLYRDAARSHRRPSFLLSEGAEASDHLTRLLAGVRSVELEFDVEKYDKYDRLLAYVYLPDGTMLNEAMLRDGFARLDSFPPNDRYRGRLEHAARIARRERAGLWARDPG